MLKYVIRAAALYDEMLIKAPYAEMYCRNVDWISCTSPYAITLIRTAAPYAGL